MTRRYRQFTQEFKYEALRQMEETDKPISQLARELDLRVNQLYKWKAQLSKKQDKALKRTAKSSDQSASISEASELKRLRQQVERLEAENAILKKAAAYFAKDLV